VNVDQAKSIALADSQLSRRRARRTVDQHGIHESSSPRICHEHHELVAWIPRRRIVHDDQRTGQAGLLLSNLLDMRVIDEGAGSGRREAVIDERYNHGGMVADFIVGELSRRQTGGYAMRDGRVLTSPISGISGPKVMLINESAGSGGDALPYNFRFNQIGPLIGTRTWGGLVGTTGTPPTIDGGGITAPGLAFFDLKNQWAIENEGITPDIEVENNAASVIAGRDPQLERGVQEALRLLDHATPPRIARPRPIDRASRPGSH
jgi:tricorn protease